MGASLYEKYELFVLLYRYTLYTKIVHIRNVSKSQNQDQETTEEKFPKQK